MILSFASYLHGVIVGLNWMYGVRSTDLAIRELTAAQLEAHSVIIARATDLHARLMGSIDSRANSGWGHYEQGGTAPAVRLDASIVAVPDCAGLCDPRDVVSDPVLSFIRDSTTIFPSVPAGLE